MPSSLTAGIIGAMLTPVRMPAAAKHAMVFIRRAGVLFATLAVPSYFSHIQRARTVEAMMNVETLAYVLGLQVAVDDTEAVRFGERLCDRARVRGLGGFLGPGPSDGLFMQAFTRRVGPSE